MQKVLQMIFNIDTSILQDDVCKQCQYLHVSTSHSSLSEVPTDEQIREITGINMYEVCNGDYSSIPPSIKLQDLQETKTSATPTSCTLGYLWVDALNLADPQGKYKFECVSKFKQCDYMGFRCYYWK